jgi:hypothetical protein
MQTRGVWIIELSELDSLSHSEVTAVRHAAGRVAETMHLRRHRQPTARTFAMRPAVAGSGRSPVAGSTSFKLDIGRSEDLEVGRALPPCI